MNRSYFERQDDVVSLAYWYQCEPHRPIPKAVLETDERLIGPADEVPAMLEVSAMLAQISLEFVRGRVHGRGIRSFPGVNLPLWCSHKSAWVYLFKDQVEPEGVSAMEIPASSS